MVYVFVSWVGRQAENRYSEETQYVGMASFPVVPQYRLPNTITTRIR